MLIYTLTTKKRSFLITLLHRMKELSADAAAQTLFIYTLTTKKRSFLNTLLYRMKELSADAAAQTKDQEECNFGYSGCSISDISYNSSSKLIKAFLCFQLAVINAQQWREPDVHVCCSRHLSHCMLFHLVIHVITNVLPISYLS